MSRFTVSAVSPDELGVACRMLFAQRSGADRQQRVARCHELLTVGEMDPAGLFVARDDHDTICGAILVQPLSGALGLAWPPGAEHDGERTAIEDALIGAAHDWLRSCGVKVCQAFAAEDDRPAMAPLERHGFRRVTQVSHMRRDLDPARTALRPAGPLDFHPHRARQPAPQFRPTLLATNTGSLDAPELTGARSDDELAGGYLEDGYLAFHRGEPVGVLLLDPLTQPGVTEISYLGLIPSARGRGFGDELLTKAIGTAESYGSHTAHVSVDVRNEPAVKLYHRHGFAEYDRQDVYLAVWPSERGA